MCRQWAGAALAAAAVAVGTLPAAAAMLRVQAVRHPRSARAGCPVPRRVRQGRLARRCLLTVTHDVATGSPERKSSAQSALHSAGGCRTLPFLSSPRAEVCSASSVPEVRYCLDDEFCCWRGCCTRNMLYFFKLSVAVVLIVMILVWLCNYLRRGRSQPECPPGGVRPRAQQLPVFVTRAPPRSPSHAQPLRAEA
ncbi:Protein of unknown function, partial [Gryllus bimaculatus]